jgi:hypothetical protein
MLKNFLRPQFTNAPIKLECFVPGKPFQCSLILVSEAGVFEAPHWSSTLGQALGLAHVFILDKEGK